MRFTIATITSNNAQGLEKTWKSIKSQTCNDYEWLVQDGASTDETLKILKNTPATVMSECDNGIYDAMNRLIERASGDYILFLNAGDALASPDTLEKLSTIDADLIYGDAHEANQRFVRDSKKEANQGFVHEPKYHYKPARTHKKIARGMFTHHQSMFYRQTKINDLRYNETYKIAADYDFTARYLKTCHKIEYVPHAICIFEPNGISQQQTNQGRIEQFQIRKALKLCTPIQNHAITAMQNLNIKLRKRFPRIYWTIKKFT